MGGLGAAFPLADRVLVGLALSMLRRRAFGAHSFVGKAVVQAEFTGSATGERLWASLDARLGRKILRGKSQAWHDVRSACDEWGDPFAKRQAELRSGKGAPKE